MFDKKEPYNVANFLELNENNDYLQSEKLNSIIYKKFMGSKRHDSVKEYSDTFMRLLSVTGVVHLKNGIAKLKFRDLWTILFNDINLENFIFSNSTKIEYKAYEENPESSFYKHVSIEKILGIQKEQGEVILNNVADNLGVSTVNEAKEKLKTGVNDEFVEFIKENYPKEKTIQLLSMFSDRSNDKEIQSMVGSTASVPTIFEYLVGIAWYHISKKEYDVFSSFNLTMNADFTPETHAGGGDGDIIVHYDNTVVMLEVTLMNKQAQKRGEWEPVLRHSANLTIDVAPKKVVTFFIADELDDNTINIWRAVASVPLKSSREAVNKGRLARNVTIMPLKNNELVKIIEKNTNEEALIESIEDSFLELDHEFDSEWREEIIKDIM
ncbi:MULTISPECIES: AlwI family type II restriction endonuclease [Enterococcus]|uniref:AlwI family type II restriction endonuclease n=1 Tax=Enterococcus TaxID=1350 RepID=UPI002244D669|nr:MULTISPECIES: AlwI family type II restriction endonuclease [Enterococcus]